VPNWGDVLQEIASEGQAGQAKSIRALTTVRQKYLQQLHGKTGRNIIAYYSGFLSKPGIAQQDINDEDKNGFMMAVHKLDKAKGLDLFLHTPGGGIAATESIIDYLHKMFKKDIRAVIPQIAMSAGTMMACSSKRILMGEHSNLGPIDPHLNGIPAKGVIDEFKRVLKEVKADNTKIDVWKPILQQYRPTFLGQCENAIKWSQKFVEDHLTTVMFEGDSKARSKARKITRALLDYSRNKTHARHFHLAECRKMGLQVDRIEDDPQLQDLILTVHHCYMHALMNTPAIKVVENQNGVAFVKQIVQQKPS
jgi:ClpP class serine protease